LTTTRYLKVNSIQSIQVLIYNGQLDIILGPALSEKFIKTIIWSGSEEYRRVERKIWKVNSKLAGYVREVKQFRFILFFWF
jgi:hypothetical protein